MILLLLEEEEEEEEEEKGGKQPLVLTLHARGLATSIAAVYYRYMCVCIVVNVSLNALEIMQWYTTILRESVP